MTAPTCDIDTAARLIRAGGLVGMPTETVYGLAADALAPAAVARLFAAKCRPQFDPLIVHVADAAGAAAVAHGDVRAQRLMAAFWPGPLTLLLPKRACIPDLVTSGLPRVGVRCPDHPLAQALITRSACPLAAPSANLFGRISPTCAAHVVEQLGDRIDGILDGGPCRVGLESTVLSLDPTPCILRPGGITLDAIAAVLGEPVTMADRPTATAHLPAAAPGLLASHYAPRVPLRLRAADATWPDDPQIALLAFADQDLPAQAPRAILSPRGDLTEAATRLFALLRSLDAAAPTAIVAELVPATGLGLAINDRLRRAAGLG